MARLIRYPDARASRLDHGPVLVTTQPGVFRITGPGSVACVQGVVSHDVAGPGPNSLGYGAMLTAKGMIAVDLWTIRLDDAIVLVVEAASAETVAGLLARQLPPRLARVRDETGTVAALWAIGRRAQRPEFPAAGRVAVDEHGTVTARGTGVAWFDWVAIGSIDHIEALRRGWSTGGAPIGDADDLAAAKIRAGFPSAGAEIGDKTLPQEVDFDRLGAVSYTKGCFVGQETVARLHSRGHPNWLLRRFRHPGPGVPDEVLVDGKVIARLGTGLVADDGGITGLALVRREVDLATPVGGFQFDPIGGEGKSEAPAVGPGL